jgi:hypothetical protein
MGGICMAILKRTSRTDTETGRILNESRQLYNVYDREKGYLFRANAYYVKSFNGIRLSDTIKNKSDLANAHILSENIYKDSNMIAYTRNRFVYPADVPEIAAMIDVCERRTKEFLVRMQQLGVVKKFIGTAGGITEVQYYINPLYYMSNKRIQPFMYMLFRDQLNPYLNKNAREWLNEAANLKNFDGKIEEVPPVTKKNEIVPGSLKDKANKALKSNPI